MRYSIEPRDRRYVKGYGFLSFAKNIGKNITNKYRQQLVDSAIKSGATKVATDAIKTGNGIPNNNGILKNSKFDRRCIKSAF